MVDWLFEEWFLSRDKSGVSSESFFPVVAMDLGSFIPKEEKEPPPIERELFAETLESCSETVVGCAKA